MDSLRRFLDAQAPVYGDVVEELRSGRKTTHWMWFVFPQLKGLGRSATAQYYGLDGRDEAQAYARHEVLGARLVECTQAVLACRSSALDIFGTPDDIKLRSSMTVFEAVWPDNALFRQALAQFFDGRRDEASLKLLEQLPKA